MTRTMPCARTGLPSVPANQRPISSTQSFVSVAGLGANAILDLIGDAAALSRLSAIDDGVEARLRILGFEDLRVAAAGGNRLHVADQQHLGGIGAPVQDVGVDAPVIGNFADRREDLGQIDSRHVDVGSGRMDQISRTDVGQSRLFEDR